MTLGLERGTVRLVDYDPSWPTFFEQEKRLLLRLLGPALAAIEHVGSTAVPGLPSKPIIDIAVAVERYEAMEGWSALLPEEGYTSFLDRESNEDWFFAKGPDAARTVYLHAVLAGSRKWKNYLWFRNQLRENASLRQAYGLLKEELAQMSPGDRLAYTQGKAGFIQGILKND
jgi:GrpB-like predicted nucleotidyltransferase (UPF0157 family)